MEPTDDLQMVTPEEASKLLAVAPQTLAHWRCAGEGPAYVKIGRLVRYPKRALLEWLEQRTRRPIVKPPEPRSVSVPPQALFAPAAPPGPAKRVHRRGRHRTSADRIAAKLKAAAEEKARLARQPDPQQPPDTKPQ